MLRIFIALIVLLTPSIARAACSSPAGAESQTRYDFTSHSLLYCNGTSWVKVESATSNYFYCTHEQSDNDGIGDSPRCVSAALSSDTAAPRYRTLSCQQTGFTRIGGGLPPYWGNAGGANTPNAGAAGMWRVWANVNTTCIDGSVLVVDTQPHLP